MLDETFEFFDANIEQAYSRADNTKNTGKATDEDSRQSSQTDGRIKNIN